MPTLQELTSKGQELDALLHVQPSERPDLSCGGVLHVVGVTKYPSNYVITASLSRNVKVCPHCGSKHLKMHGRFLIRLADVPYIDPALNYPYPVEYSINAQRYLCDDCRKGVAEQLPETLAPVVTTSRITNRLSCWLIYQLQTKTPYTTISRMVGYSTVWLRKWNSELKEIFGLGDKPSKPGRKARDA